MRLDSITITLHMDGQDYTICAKVVKYFTSKKGKPTALFEYSLFFWDNRPKVVFANKYTRWSIDLCKKLLSNYLNNTHYAEPGH